MRVAVCLFVRNEVSDMASWLAWYRLLGVDTCLIYDDGSSDGTVELCEAIGKLQDIRIHSAKHDGDHKNHTVRQDACYRHALEAYSSAFDWIGFFDSDEYLRLYQDEDVKSFIARYPEASSISVNWCNYGSSGHVFKPVVSPLAAYAHHASASNPINRHVKSFVRAGAWNGRIVNGHAFEVGAGRMVGANGNPVLWSETFGIIANDPDWSVAKVMHYQCRSMEHFLDRLRRAPKHPRTTTLWRTLDVQDERDEVPLKVLVQHAKLAASYSKLVAMCQEGKAAPPTCASARSTQGSYTIVNTRKSVCE